MTTMRTPGPASRSVALNVAQFCTPQPTARTLVIWLSRSSAFETAAIFVVVNLLERRLLRVAHLESHRRGSRSETSICTTHYDGTHVYAEHRHVYAREGGGCSHTRTPRQRPGGGSHLQLPDRLLGYGPVARAAERFVLHQLHHIGHVHGDRLDLLDDLLVLALRVDRIQGREDGLGLGRRVFGLDRLIRTPILVADGMECRGLQPHVDGAQLGRQALLRFLPAMGCKVVGGENRAV
mmetsp:Transcript_103305/g.296771  ORF Transcript_103305/g.296771 Transcript_103305/m.296771 type:complete len:237 (-) Transcript_103305:771-1481(-)